MSDVLVNDLKNTVGQKQSDKSPVVRFDGFTDAWEQRNLSDLANRYDNLRVPITASDRVLGNIPYYGANGIQDYVEGYTHDGDFILVAEDGANDLRNYPVQCVKGKVWVNNHAHVLQSKKDEADNMFLMNAIKYINIEPFLVGGGRAKLNADIMMKLKFNVPLKIEQTQIGNLFEQLDDNIALHQRKLDILSKTKQTFLQKMFPKKGSSVPEIRLDGFTDDWEERNLGSISDLYQPSTISKSDLLENGIPVFGANGYIGYYDQPNHDENQVTISARGEKTGTVNYVKGPVWITGNSMVVNLDDQKDIDKLFICNNLLNISLEKYVTGGAQPQLTRNILEKVRIYITSLEEQQKIGSFFNTMDDRIEAEQTKIKQLQEMKNALLQRMFV